MAATEEALCAAFEAVFDSDTTREESLARSEIVMEENHPREVLHQAMRRLNDTPEVLIGQ
jgi:hypothetical protein